MLIGDLNPERLAHAKSVGFEPTDMSKSDKLEDLIEAVLGVPEVDASIDAVGFEARGHGSGHTVEAPATVLNSLMTVTRAAGGIGIPGLYVTEDPGSKNEAAQRGSVHQSAGIVAASFSHSRIRRGKYCAQVTSRCDINMTPESLPELFQLEAARFSLEHLRDPSLFSSCRYRRYRRHLLQMARRLP
jgi:threonine dehydrogenase-like Zn-dependent dehydrogenase